MFKGVFGDMFDLNDDGKLDAMEQGLEYMLLDELSDVEDDDEGGED